MKFQDWRLRCRAICSIEEMLKSTDNLVAVQPRLESLLRTLLSPEKNLDVLEDKRRICINLISRLPLDNLEDRTSQILIGLCRQGGAGSNRVAKALMQRLPPASVLRKLVSDDLLLTHNSKVRYHNNTRYYTRSSYSIKQKIMEYIFFSLSSIFSSVKMHFKWFCIH